MKTVFIIFLTMQISAFSITGAVAGDKADAGSTTSTPDGANVDEQDKGRSVIQLEEAMESKSLRISLNVDTGSGFVIGRICDQCDEIRVTITPETRAFNGASQVPLASARDRLGRYATVFINMKKNEVTRIKW